jgi:hypothetical protein
MMGLLPRFSSYTSLWLVFYLDIPTACTPLWLASYLDIQAVLLCNWPSKLDIQAELLCDKLCFSVIGLLPEYSSCTPLYLAFYLDIQAKLLCDRHPNMDIQATLPCDSPSTWIFQLHFSVIGLLPGYSSWTALCFTFLPGYSSHTPLWFASYMDIKAKLLLYDWYPSWIFELYYSMIGFLTLIQYSSWTASWLASYLDIQAVLQCDWPPTKMFKLDCSLLRLPIWII